MNFRNIIREYFTFTRNERIGLIALIILIVLTGAANQLIYCFEKPREADLLAFQNQIAKFESEKQLVEQDNEKRKTLFSFDPNEIDSLQLDSLNLPPQVKWNLLKYRKSGGEFYRREDIQKIYGMTDSVYSAIGQYVRINKRQTNQSSQSADNKHTSFKKESVAQPKKKLEINGATEADFKTLRGIGDVLSKRIVKYKNLLGGYYQVGQLCEVYGLPDETLSEILPLIEVDSTKIQKINVNFASKRELAGHPYLGWEEAQALVDFKSKVGFINDINELRDENLLCDSIYIKIFPYLKTKN
ncbi:helix-hairpin-helix domain-containing protein [Sunxiuqinia sp. A32]|uniref:helix-hairpin-helix domain-containing protein n=1 Tax=Sunxiuqinia sp. A32 TaxID=3461496 RepID=UPI0040459BC3